MLEFENNVHIAGDGVQFLMGTTERIDLQISVDSPRGRTFVAALRFTSADMVNSAGACFIKHFVQKVGPEQTENPCEIGIFSGTSTAFVERIAADV